MKTLPFTDFWPLFGTNGLRAGINRRNFIVLRLHATASCDQGRIQEFWLGGAWSFFSKAWDLGAVLMPPLGPGQRPGGSLGGEAPGSS